MRHIDAGRDRELSISRRRCLSVASALTLAALSGIRLSASALSGGAVQPFRIDVPRATVARIRRRVAAARWPERLGGDDWRYGANWDYMRRLADYWTKTYDWTKAEARLNKHPQYLARIGAYSIHFYHVRGKGPRPVPLILTHGWPGSFVEFLEIIGPLTDPARFGGSPDQAFDIVIPSIPGFGFSSKPQSPIGPPTTARLWHELMTRVLGYDRFGAQGGDWGSSVTVELARRFPDSLIGIHLNAGGGALNGPAAPTEEERQWQQAASAYRAAEIDYFNEQQHKPETVAFALYDNPLGAAAWMVEKFRGWSDSGTGIDPVFTFDQLLTNVMIYLVTDTVGTAVWFYRGAADDRSGGPAPSRNEVPVGFASFPAEMPVLNPPRSVLERNFNLVHYSKMPRGGHFACLEQPMLMAADLRAFFSQLRER